jgi:hypothetical protein
MQAALSDMLFALFAPLQHTAHDLMLRRKRAARR